MPGSIRNLENDPRKGPLMFHAVCLNFCGPKPIHSNSPFATHGLLTDLGTILVYEGYGHTERNLANAYAQVICTVLRQVRPYSKDCNLVALHSKHSFMWAMNMTS